MQILKFGGSSVANPERIRACGRVLTHKRQTEGHRATVVCSALGGITDALTKAGTRPTGRRRIQRCSKRNPRPPHTMRTRPPGTQTYAAIEAELKERLSHLDDLLYGIYLLREASARTLDELTGLGERLSVPILWGHFQDLGFHPQRLDALELMPTDDRYGSAKLNVHEAKKRFKNAGFDEGDLFLMEGFIGQSPDGTPTTLGRGRQRFERRLCGLLSWRLRLGEVDRCCRNDDRRPPHCAHCQGDSRIVLCRGHGALSLWSQSGVSAHCCPIEQRRHSHARAPHR